MKPIDKDSNPGLAKLPTEVRNKMGYMKKGGKVSSPVNKKALEKAGFYDKDQTSAKRKSIINKVTTKPQRIEMVEKMFLTKKAAPKKAKVMR
jgi:hypothetical protein